jgi:hypothetical protein
VVGVDVGVTAATVPYDGVARDVKRVLIGVPIDDVGADSVTDTDCGCGCGCVGGRSVGSVGGKGNDDDDGTLDEASLLSKPNDHGRVACATYATDDDDDDG